MTDVTEPAPYRVSSQECSVMQTFNFALYPGQNL